jgi:hypothetical protein
MSIKKERQKMQDNQNGQFRPKRVNFAQISNTALQDANLSLKAKGLYSLIQSLITLPGQDNLVLWKIRKKCKEKEKAFDSAWKELKDAGYLKQYRIPKGEKGAFRYEYELLDEADISTSATINMNKNGETIPIAKEVIQLDIDHTPHKEGYGQAEAAKPIMPAIDHYPQNGGHGQECADGHDHTPHLAPYGQSTPCSKHPVLNGGDNSNTVFNNTVFSNTKSISQSTEYRLIDEIHEELKTQIEYEYFEDTFPEDISGIDVLIECMADMLTRPSTKINRTAQSCEALRPYISRIDSCTVKEFLDHMRGKDLSGVQNVAAYWQSALINFVREQELLKLHA